MTTLEREIVEKFNQLDEDAQQRVLALIEHKAEPADEAVKEPFDYDAWFKSVEALREQIRNDHGGVFPDIDVVGILREIRDGEDE